MNQQLIVMSNPRFQGMRAWAENRFGKPADEITISDVDRVLPRRDDLPDAPFDDRLGGRVRFRLKPWPDQAHAADLRERAQRFLQHTPED